MSPTTSFIVLVVVVVFIVLVTTGSSGRRAGSAASERGCPHCRAAHPHLARFCPRCGKRLEIDNRVANRAARRSAAGPREPT